MYSAKPAALTRTVPTRGRDLASIVTVPAAGWPDAAGAAAELPQALAARAMATAARATQHRPRYRGAVVPGGCPGIRRPAPGPVLLQCIVETDVSRPGGAGAGRRRARRRPTAVPGQQEGGPHARHEQRPRHQQPGRGGGVPVGPAAPGHCRPADLRCPVGGLGGGPGLARGRGGRGPGRGWSRGRGGGGAGRAAGPADRVRAAVAAGLPAAGAAGDGGGTAVPGGRGSRGRGAGVGAAPGELGRDGLVVSPGAGRGGGGVDPGRHRAVAAVRGAGPADAAGRGGGRGGGPGCGGVGRGAGGGAGPGLGRVLLAWTGAVLAASAVLQAWPGRGFWQGSVAGQPGSLTSMVQ